MCVLADAPLDAVESCPAPQLIDQIKVLQVNLNKSNAAQLELSIPLRKERDFICLITEPATIRNRLAGIPKSYNVIPEARENSPRAAIYTSKTVQIHKIASLRHRDLAVDIIKIGGCSTAIISAYMDIKNIPIPEHLVKAIEYCKCKGYGILLGVDTNSHSKLWGNETNQRGKKWEQFIEDEELVVHNTGRIPTFESKIGKSCIDITCSFRLPTRISDWRVLRSYNGTDHNSIHYTLEQAKIMIPACRLYKKANWDTFKEVLRTADISIPSKMTEAKTG